MTAAVDHDQLQFPHQHSQHAVSSSGTGSTGIVDEDNDDDVKKSVTLPNLDKVLLSFRTFSAANFLFVAPDGYFRSISQSLRSFILQVGSTSIETKKVLCQESKTANQII